MPGLEIAGLPADPGNITIPINAIPAIQTAIINAGVQVEIIFFIIGLVTAFVFSYLYFQLWKKAKGIDV